MAFVAGRCCIFHVLTKSSLFWDCRLDPSLVAVEDNLVFTCEKEGQDWAGSGDELGRLVSILGTGKINADGQLLTLDNSAAIASFIKSAHVHLMVSEDFSCLFTEARVTFDSPANHVTVDGWTLVLWAILEPTVTIIATSVPVIRTFVRDLARSFTRRRGSCSVDSEGQQRTGDPGASTAGTESTPRRLPWVGDKERVILAELNVDAEFEESKTEGQQGDGT